MNNDLVNQAYAESEADYNRRRDDIISRLMTARAWIDEAIDFIKEDKI